MKTRKKRRNERNKNVGILFEILGGGGFGRSSGYNVGWFGLNTESNDESLQSENNVENLENNFK